MGPGSYRMASGEYKEYIGVRFPYTCFDQDLRGTMHNASKLARGTVCFVGSLSAWGTTPRRARKVMELAKGWSLVVMDET